MKCIFRSKRPLEREETTINEEDMTTTQHFSYLDNLCFFIIIIATYVQVTCGNVTGGGVCLFEKINFRFKTIFFLPFSDFSLCILKKKCLTQSNTRKKDISTKWIL